MSLIFFFAEINAKRKDNGIKEKHKSKFYVIWIDILNLCVD